MFTTCTHTGLNIGLQQGHHTAIPPRQELDGDLEREHHQYRTQLDAHPVSPVAVLRFRRQVVVEAEEEWGEPFHETLPKLSTRCNL